MTPNEQVLRARLEQVLQSSNSRGSRSDDRYRRSEWNGEELSERTDSSDENYAYDENGRWVQGCAVGGKHGMSVMAVTPPSSGSNSARSMSREDMTTLPASASAYHHQRSRSRTEPAPVVPSAHAYPSPKRTHTTPASYHQRSQTRHGQYHHHGRSGTTPPLVSDGSPTPEEEDEDEDPEDVRLLTPPPTPPSQMAAYHHYSMGRHAKEYMPSPYKTTFDHRRSATAAPPLRYDHRRGRSGVPSAYSDDHDDADDDDDDDDEYDEEEESCSCSGGRCSGLCSRLSSTLHHRSQSMQHFGGIQSTGPQPHRPQFNVRRASARCRQMDGYVGFAEIEGLGVPPDSSDSSDEETKRRLIMAQRKREGGGVTEWVRWTKRRLLGGGEDEQQTQQRQQQHQQAHNAVVL
ncbi:hypothetical protein CC1G_02364 [Coprinopsis cinerea okayama7|uniref:Uncharacterized protein n=1 Tax=Coprinopsis cinerea (strain Okayama-7 / 130 / ATCC MYA-4618 / FGSC 9003) TaxID=240176 RepID=A8N7V7_COPC7|nr:hypothetical protein CC1G_02364 [Coprinopsis cinerea okayama7\|eukprot:XP_001830913.2 hypothetical protein CC1G_02364 [Coprinopsis cinerea okayama7\